MYITTPGGLHRDISVLDRCMMWNLLNLDNNQILTGMDDFSTNKSETSFTIFYFFSKFKKLE